MIYFDCAATSLQKPRSVPRAVLRSMKTMASPGRGSHAPSMLAAETAFACRMELAQLFHVPEPEQVVFTFNATHALNIAICSLVHQGDKVVVTGYEHNSVMRPLYGIGANPTIVRSALFDDEELLTRFQEALPGAKAAVCTAMSNVFGYQTPIQQIAELCRESRVPLIIDASQLAGCGPLDFQALGAAYMAMPGHKGLLGPQGTGVLLCGETPSPVLWGGTGSESKRMEMPEFLPDRLEAGTHNLPGIAGLLEGVSYVRRVGADAIGAHERKLLRRFLKEVKKIEGLETFVSPNLSNQGGVVSLRHKSIDCEVLSQTLGEAGVAVRGGIHCAPAAHQTAGTYHSGTVRFSFSPFNTEPEVGQGVQILRNCVNKLKI